MGRVWGEDVEKEEKNYQRHLTCSSGHYFPQFLRLENMQHTKKKQQQHVAFKHHVTTVGGILPWQPSHSFPNEVKWWTGQTFRVSEWQNREEKSANGASGLDSQVTVYMCEAGGAEKKEQQAN